MNNQSRAANSGFTIWCNKRKALEILGLSESTLKRMRKRNELIEGVHWSRFSSKCIRYNAKLLEDWAANKGDMTTHRRAIDDFLQDLPSNKPKRRKRRNTLDQK